MPHEAKEGIFDPIVGHDGAKAVMRAALRSGDVHLLLTGPPGSGKSTALLQIEEEVPGVTYVDGKSMDPHRLQDIMAEDPPLLLIDEFDAMRSDAYDVLSIPLEHGRVVKQSPSESYDVEVGTQIIASCNVTDDIPPHTLSRMREVSFVEYDESQYFDLCEKILPKNIDWINSPEMGREVGEIVYEVTDSRDPRDARDVAMLANNTDEVRDIARAMMDPQAKIESAPIQAADVARAKPEVGKRRLEEMVFSRRSVAEVEGDSESVDEEVEEMVRERIQESMGQVSEHDDEDSEDDDDENDKDSDEDVAEEEVD